MNRHPLVAVSLEIDHRRSGSSGPRPRPRVGSLSRLDRLLARFREETRLDGPLFSRGLPRPPRSSVAFGAAGIALALCRLATVFEDPRAIVAARGWIERAERDTVRAGAFYDTPDFPEAALGRVSPWHTSSGVALVRASIHRLCGETADQQRAIADFISRTEAPCRNLDLWLGRCGVLVGASLLLRDADDAWPVADRLRRHGDELLAGVWNDLSPQRGRCLGMAHGWSGLIYATLLWSRVGGAAPPPGARELLTELAALAEAHGRGLRWPWSTNMVSDSAAYWPGWCGGQAGHVFVWTLAAAEYREPALIQYAEGAAWSVWERPSSVEDLCCGAAGCAYALLNLYRASGDAGWLHRARRLAHAAAKRALLGDGSPNSTSTTSLYKGYPGLALLAGELRSPELSAMPLFELAPGLEPAPAEPAAAMTPVTHNHHNQ